MQFLISVIILGCVYAMLAAGFVVIYKSSRVLNFAYSDMVILAAYLAVTLTQLIAGPPLIALFISVIISLSLIHI